MQVPKGFNPRHVFSDGDQGTQHNQQATARLCGVPGATEAHKAAVKQFQASGRGLLDHNGRAGLLGEKQHKPEQPDTEVREVLTIAAAVRRSECLVRLVKDLRKTRKTS